VKSNAAALLFVRRLCGGSRQSGLVDDFAIFDARNESAGTRRDDLQREGISTKGNTAIPFDPTDALLIYLTNLTKNAIPQMYFQ
jgi:hypothetical protein